MSAPWTLNDTDLVVIDHLREVQAEYNMARRTNPLDTMKLALVTAKIVALRNVLDTVGFDSDDIDELTDNL